MIREKGRAIKDRYKEMNHWQRKKELCCKTRIFERSTSETTLTTHFDLLINNDRRALEELLRVNENRILSQIEAILPTPVEREREEETTIIRDQRMIQENETIQREAGERTRACSTGNNE